MLDKNDESAEKTIENKEKSVVKNEETLKEKKEVQEEKVADKVSEDTSLKEVISSDDATTEVIEAIDNKVAEEAEKDAEKNVIPVLDYTKMELEDLVKELETLLKNNQIQQIKTQVEGIKNAFNLKFGTLLAEKKAAFLAEGGNSIDFQYSNPIKITYNKLLSEYKHKRDAYYADLEKQLKANLEKRVEVIEKLKQLIANADTKTMYKKFRELQDQWRAIGPVPKTRYNDTWKTYHHHVERFYDLLHLSNDFRDLDFKHNLEEKLKIIKKAEALAEEADINHAFKELQELHKLWKEEIGPVAKEMREEIWQKFSAATKKIHDRRHEYYRSLKSKFQEIIEKKQAIIDEINAYDTSHNKTHNDWQKSIKEIEVLRKKYFDAGKLPYSKSEDVWQKFKAATKKFNKAKNDFYKQEKSGQQENLKKKLALIEVAESLKDSEDWDSATNAMKKVQADWKKIGHVPRKFSDDIWKRFKAACNHYFDRLHENKNAVNKEQQAIIDAKKEFLEKLKTVENITLELINEAISEWKALGQLPRNVRHLEGKFNKQVDKMLEKLSLSKEEIAMLKFKNTINSYLAQKDYRKLDAEQLFLRKKIDETVREMQQLENNLSFVSNATEDNPLVQNVRKQISKYKEDLDIWQLKLDYLKKLDY